MSRIDRIKKLEGQIKPLAERVTILSPTDEEWEEYRTGSKPLPNGPYDFNFKNTSTDKLRELAGSKKYEYGPAPQFKETDKSRRVFTSEFSKLSMAELEREIKRYDIEE